MIIATRSLVLHDGEHETIIPIEVHAPEQSDGHWICRFEIGWPEGKLERYGAGFDSVQAMLIALQMIGAHIYTSDHHKSGRLVWGEARQGYGFPVTNNIRDLLVGDDKTFF